MATTSTKIGHGLAKVLGIKLHQDHNTDPVTRGESVFSISSADTYVEEEPSSLGWLREQIPSGRDVAHYFYSLFPFTHWITRYNLQWLYGDLVAGITVGAVVVPQSMAYAKLAAVPVQFGLYSSFMGVLIYWFFATSKDITIGPVAVLSTITGNLVLSDAAKSLPKSEQGHVYASAVALIAGCIVIFIGLARIGWIVDFISLTAIAAFMTGSAINIAVGQVPTLMGITGFSTRDSTYKVVIHILQHLGRSNLNAAMGLTALFLLYFIRFSCNQLAKRYPNKRKTFFFISTLRTAFVILLYTLISFLVNRHHRKKPKFTILGKVPRGFKYATAPVINKQMIKAFAKDLPAVVIVMLIEHISISKSFGRVNNYVINPSQELVAIGITNILGPFLGAYPATGSFSRTAIKSKAGVRTPFAGVITAVVVLLAIYALTAVFFYIPSASLSAVIIHAVLDLITPPNTLYKFWRISPLELPIFLAGVLVTVFSSIENGVYTVISVSAALLLFRVFKARGHFLGKVKIHSVIGDHLVGGGFEEAKGETFVNRSQHGYAQGEDQSMVRNAFLPIDHEDGSNPAIDLDEPSPGIFIFRFSEGYEYLNANHYTNYLTEVIFQKTRRTNPAAYPRLGDRPWNDPGPRRGQTEDLADNRPTLKAIILDMASVNYVDVTGVQILIDVRNQLDRYAAPNAVEWHFASINNRWTKRALASAGFGNPNPLHTGLDDYQRWKPVFSVAEIGGDNSPAAFSEWEQKREQERRSRSTAENVEAAPTAGVDEHYKQAEYKQAESKTAKLAVTHGINRPLFHVDLTSALQSAIQNVERRETAGPKVVSES